MANNDEIIIGASLDIDKVVGLEDSLKAVESALKNNPVFKKELEVTGSKAILTNLRQVADEAGKIKSMIASVKIGDNKFDFELRPEKVQEYSKSVKELVKEYKEEINAVNNSSLATNEKLKKIEQLNARIKDLNKNKENSASFREQDSKTVETGNFSVEGYKQMSDFNSLLTQVESKYKEVERAQKDVNKAISSGKKEQEEFYTKIRNEKLEEAVSLEQRYVQLIKESSQAQQNVSKAKSGYTTERGIEDYTREQNAIRAISKDLKELNKLKTEQARVSVETRDTSSNDNYNNVLETQISLLEAQIEKKRELAGISKETLNVQLQEIERSSQRAEAQAKDSKQEQENVVVTRKVNELKEKYIKLLRQETEVRGQIQSGRAEFKGVGKEQLLQDIQNSQKQLDLEAQQIDQQYKHVDAAETLTKAVKEYDSEQERSANITKKNTSLTANFSDGIKDAIARVANYTIAYRSMWMAIQGFKSSIRIIEELNKTMTDIQMVTGQTASQTAELTTKYSQMAQELGATTTDIAEAANEYIRQGKTVAETNDLITQSLHLAKIGGMETSESTEYLTSVMMAYKLQVEEVSHVVDALSAVDLEAATSSKDIAIALQQSANSASLAGVSFEKLTGYIATVEEVTQKSASTVGNSMKSMFSRLQNVKAGKFLDDTGEAINDVEKVLTSLDIKLRKDKDNWRDMGDVLGDVSEAWAGYSDTEKNAVATSIAGTHQRENFLALMNNYDKALGYEKTAMESNGQAAQKYNTYLDNLEASKNRLKATTEELVYSEETVKAYKISIDTLNGLLSILKSLNPIIAILSVGLGIILTKLGVNLPSAIKKLNREMLKATFELKANSRAMDESSKSGMRLSNVMNKTKQAFADTGTKVKAISKAFDTLKTTMVSIASSYAIFTVISMTTDAVDGFINSTEELKNKANETGSKIQELQSSIDSLNAIKNPTEEDKKKLEMLNIQIERQKELLSLQSKDVIQKDYFGGVEEGFKGLGKELSQIFTDPLRNIRILFNDIDDNTMEAINTMERAGQKAGAISVAESRINTVLDEQKSTLEKINELKNKDNKTEFEKEELEDLIESYNDAGGSIDEFKAKLSEYYAELEKANEETNGEDESIKALMASIEEIIGEKTKLVDKNGEVIESTQQESDHFETLTAVYENLKTNTELMTDAWGEFNDKGYLTLDTVLKLIEAGYENAILIDEETGLYKLKANSMEEAFEAEKKVTLQSLKEKEAKIQATIAEMETDIEMYKLQQEGAVGAVKANMEVASSSVEAMSSMATTAQGAGAVLGQIANAGIAYVNKALESSKKTEAALARISNAGGIDKYTDKLSAARKNLSTIQTQIKFIESASFEQMSGSAYDAADALKKEADSANAAKEATDALKDSIDGLKSKLDDLKDTLSDMKDNLDKTKEGYEAFKNAVLNQIESEIDALEKLKEKNDERQKYYEVMKDMVTEWYEDEIEAKQDLIDKAEEEAEKQIGFINKKIEALDAEKDASDKLKEIEEARLEVEKAQMALDKLKGQKTQRVYKKGEGYTYEVDTGAIQEQEDALKEAQNNYSELLKNWNFEQQKTALQDMIKAIEEARDRTISALQEQIDALQKEADAWGDALDFENEAIKKNVDVQKWMTEYKKADTATRMKMLADFNADYHDKIYKANLDTESQIKKLQELKEQWSKSMDIADDLSKYKGMQEDLKKFENATYEERKTMLSTFTSKYQAEYKKQNDAIIALESQIKELEGVIKTAQKKLDSMKSSADNASSSLGGLKSQIDDLDGSTIHINEDRWYTETDGNGTMWSVHKINNNIVSRTKLGQFYGEKGKDQQFRTSSGGIIAQYATGGLGDFSGAINSQVVSRTGKVGDSDIYVDGTPKFSELMLNASDAARVWNWVQKLPVTPSGNTVNNNDRTSIGQINVTADSNSTLTKILLEAKGVAKTRQ